MIYPNLNRFQSVKERHATLEKMDSRFCFHSICRTWHQRVHQRIVSVPCLVPSFSTSREVGDDNVDFQVPAAGGEAKVWTRFIAETLLPTRQGKFRLRGYRHTLDGGRTFTEPSAIISGSVTGAEDVIVRVHDACFTSEVLGSLKCDCREQLQLALEAIRDSPPGMVIYLQQEGRGIGLANKIAAYALQEKGLDTVDANRALGLPDDCREYSAVKHILDELDVKSVRLMTNNPRKIKLMEDLGIMVSGRLPCVVKAQKYNEGYLTAKKRRMMHMLGSFDDMALDFQPITMKNEQEVELDGSFCYLDHEGEPSQPVIPIEAKIHSEHGKE